MLKYAVLVFALVCAGIMAEDDTEEKEVRKELKLAVQDSTKAGDRLRKAIQNKPPFKYILKDGSTIDADAVYEKQDDRSVKLLIGRDGKVIREIKEDQIKEVVQPDRSELDAAVKDFDQAKKNMDRALEAMRKVSDRKKQEREQKSAPEPKSEKKVEGRHIILDGETVLLIKRGDPLPPPGVRFSFEGETC